MENARKARAKKTDIGYGYDSIFPSQLRNLLDRPDMTQEKLADSLGIARQSVSQWKDGKTMPDIYYLKKISEFFGVCYEYLLDGTESEQKENVDINEKTGLPDESIRLLRNLKKDSESTAIKAKDSYLAYTTLRAIVFLLSEENQGIFTLLGRYFWDKYSTDIKVKNEETGEMTSRLEFMNETSGMKDYLLTDYVSAAVFSRLQERLIELKLKEERERVEGKETHYEKMKREREENEVLFRKLQNKKRAERGLPPLHEQPEGTKEAANNGEHSQG